MALSDTKLRQLAKRPPAERLELKDKDGMVIRVGVKGVIRFTYKYKFKEKPKRIYYGTYPAVSLAEAREAHFNARAMIRDGRCPLEEQKAAEAAEAEKASLREQGLLIETFSDMAEYYLSRHGRKLARGDDVERHLKIWIERYGQIPFSEIKPVQVSFVLDEITDQGKEAKANHALMHLKGCANWCKGRGIIDNNHLSDMPLPNTLISRDYFYPDEHIAVIWKALSESKKAWPSFRRAAKLVVLTSQRQHSAVKAERTHFELDEKIWRIPPELTKTQKGDRKADGRMVNGKPFIVPLSDQAVQVVKEAMKISRDPKYVFVNSSGEGMIEPRNFSRTWRTFLKSVMVGDQAIEEGTLHDWRRTLYDQLLRMGHSEIVIEKILGHKLQGMQAVYNRHDYLDKKIAALQDWADRLDELAAGEGKVIHLDRWRA